MTDRLRITKINEYEEIAELSPEYIKDRNEKLYKIRLQHSGIPEKYWNLELDMYQGTISIGSLNKVKTYIEKMDEEKFKHLNLFLTGKNSTQKTLCATNIGKAFLKNGYRVKFVYAGELVDILLKNQGFSYIKDIEEFINDLFLADLLIIDDFADEEKSTYWKNNPQLIRTAWDNFLRRSISENIRIVTTSNKSFDSIKDMLGESLFQLLYRNFEELMFFDEIGDYVKKLKFEDIWD